ncbi:MAG: class I SAM-dependent methyltransferase [Thermoleophilia bacterium]
MRIISSTINSQAPCAICAATDNSDLFFIQGTHLRKCGNCGVVYVYPRPTEAELLAGYQNDYFQSDNHLEWGYDNYLLLENEIRKTSRVRLATVKKHLSGASLLEVGCATGWFLDEARRDGFTVQGVEPSDYAAAWGKKELGLPIRPGTLREAGFANGSFDGVIYWDVLEHLTDPLGELQEAARVLAKDGYLFASVPNVGSFLARVMQKKWFGYAKIREHLFFHNRKSITIALDRSGFDVVSIQRSPFYISNRFMVDKLSQYSRPLARIMQRGLKKLGQADRCFNFNLIDMMVVARKRN